MPEKWIWHKSFFNKAIEKEMKPSFGSIASTLFKFIRINWIFRFFKDILQVNYMVSNEKRMDSDQQIHLNIQTLLEAIN